MERVQLLTYDLPDCPGVYLFKEGRKVMYVGKATSLRDRVRSYFDDDLIAARGPRIVDMVTKATSLSYETTPTVLEALVRESALIREHRPKANVEGKDDKTFLYAVITDEEIPRVLAVRGKDLHRRSRALRSQDKKSVHPGALVQVLPTFFASTASGQEMKLRGVYGPFPSGLQLREGLRLIRKIFPFFDTPRPIGYAGKHHRAQVEFNRQIGQYPKEFDRRSYLKTIRKVALFLAGRTKELRADLQREMKKAAREERFEDAAMARRQLFALDHIQDVSLVKDENVPRSGEGRIEAYDTAHISGSDAIGVMTVVIDGAVAKKEYRTFRIRGENRRDDIASLKELLTRRLSHPEWQMPRAIVVDGGKTQKRAAEEVLRAAGSTIPVAAIVKDEKHRPREALGAPRAGISVSDAVLANAEAHRFALRLHRKARGRTLR